MRWMETPHLRGLRYAPRPPMDKATTVARCAMALWAMGLWACSGEATSGSTVATVGAGGSGASSSGSGGSGGAGTGTAAACFAQQHWTIQPDYDQFAPTIGSHCLG